MSVSWSFFLAQESSISFPPSFYECLMELLSSTSVFSVRVSWSFFPAQVSSISMGVSWSFFPAQVSSILFQLLWVSHGASFQHKGLLSESLMELLSSTSVFYFISTSMGVSWSFFPAQESSMSFSASMSVSWSFFPAQESSMSFSASLSVSWSFFTAQVSQ